MARRCYALVNNGPDRLEVSWEPADILHLAIQLDGTPLATVPMWKALQGTSVRLPDDSYLNIVWPVGWGVVDRLRLSRNGRPLAGSPVPGHAKPARKTPAWLRRYVGFLAFCGLVFAALGIFMLIFTHVADPLTLAFAVGFCILGGGTLALSRGLSRLKHWARIGTIALLGMLAVLISVSILIGLTRDQTTARDLLWPVIGLPFLGYGVYLLVTHASEFR